MMWTRARCLALLVALGFATSCVSVARHPECGDRFNRCSDTCAVKCEGGGSGIPDNLSEAVPSTDASAACAACVDRCIEVRNQCDDAIDAREASEPD